MLDTIAAGMYIYQRKGDAFRSLTLLQSTNGTARIRRQEWRTTKVETVNSASKDAKARLSALHERAKALVAKMTPEEKASQLMDAAPAIPRLGLDAYNWWGEALHGVARNGRATVFPEPIGMAASFDAPLVKEIGSAIGDEARVKYRAAKSIGRCWTYTALTFWSPNVNIFRDPRWGRGMETWGEDPFLTGSLGTAFIKGLQGDDPVYLKAAACAKHYAVHSGPEPLRHTFDARPSKKDLFETYLPAFEMCVREGHVEAIMGAYNRVYGDSASASKYLLTDILRGMWGFTGHVVSDCGAVCDIWNRHGITSTPAQAAALAIKSGLNVECGNCFKHLLEALQQGLVTEEEVSEALATLLTTRYRLGIAEADPECPYNKTGEGTLCSPEHRELARRMARESMVLLKNNGILPLDPTRGSIGVSGAGAADAYSLFGNYYGVSDHYSTFVEGIAAAVDPGVQVVFEPGFLYGGAASNTRHPWDGEVQIAVIGHTNAYEGEESEAIATGAADGDRVNLKLPENQLAYLRNMRAHLKDRKIITVVTGGSPVELDEVMELSDAVIFAWYAGEEGGNALADLIFGREDFSGRLPITFPVSADVLPPFEDYSMAGRTYRYQTDGIAFPFGYGLSYTRFEHGPIKADIPADGPASVSFVVSNAGQRDGVAVVQLYVSTPNAGKGHPIKSLVAFRRVPLKAGESATVAFEVPGERLTEVQEDGSRIRPEGEYSFSVAL